MTPPDVFNPQQSAEIDRRIVEMMTAVMGVGQYSAICQGIADRRAVMVEEMYARKIAEIQCPKRAAAVAAMSHKEFMAYLMGSRSDPDE